MTKPIRYRPSPALIALSALAAAAIALAVVVVGSPAATTSSGRTVTVTRGVIQSTVSGSGNLAPANQLELNFGTGGAVTKIYVNEGQHVSTGQLLARLDDSSAKVAVAQAQANLASAQDQQASASSSTASTASTSSSSAGGSGGSSGSAVSAASATAAVDSAQLALKSAEQALANTELRAPMAGTITSIAGAVGETVGSGSSTSSASGASPSSAPSSSGAAPGGSGSSSGAAGSATASTSSSAGFITLAQLHRLKMDVSVSEADIGKVKVGQPATVTVDAVPGLKLSGHVAAVGVLSSSSSSSSSAVSYPVTIVLDQGSTTARAGMSASADIVVSQVSGLSVPTQAVSRSTVTLVQNGKKVMTPVQTGVVGDSTTQIVSGVKAGDQVYVQSPSAAAGAAATGSSSSSGRTGPGSNFGGGGFGGNGFGGGGRPPAGGPAAGGRG
jgi:multidrug efflux pump subunit AcrA (membrane-fusion protein)